MLILNLERIIRMRGVKHPRAYLVNHGNSDGEARKLLSGQLKLVRLTLLTRLCETINCTPNDLLDWNGDAIHVLVGLSKDKAPDIARLLEGKSPEELERARSSIALTEGGQRIHVPVQHLEAGVYLVELELKGADGGVVRRRVSLMR